MESTTCRTDGEFKTIHRKEKLKWVTLARRIKDKRKKSKHTRKEKRKLKQEKNQQTEKKHITIPG
jgi:hypothetical protein